MEVSGKGSHNKLLKAYNSQHSRDIIFRDDNSEKKEKIDEKARNIFSSSGLFEIKDKGTKFLLTKALDIAFGTTTERLGNLEYREKMLNHFDHKKVTFKTSDGLKLKGTLVLANKHREPSGQTYLICSGSFGGYERFVRNYGGEDFFEFPGDDKAPKGKEIYPGNGILKTLTNAGHNVFLFDYRGFGENFEAGEPSRDGILNDARGAFNYVLKKVAPVEQVVMFGYSMGGEPAVIIAGENNTDLILDRIFVDSGTEAKNGALPGLGFLAKKIYNKILPMSPIEAVKNFKGKNLKLILEDKASIQKFQEALEENPHDFKYSITFNRTIPHIFSDYLQPPVPYLITIRRSDEHFRLN